MKNTTILTLCGAICMASSSLLAGTANINFGSAAELGGAQFFGSDSAAPDSIAIGYFTGDVVNNDLTGWNSLGSGSTFVLGGFQNVSLSSVDTTAAEGLNPYILIMDGALTALARVNSWVDFTGTNPPSSPSALSYTVGASITSASITVIDGIGTIAIVNDGGGTDFVGGSSGSGVSIQLTAVPEPSSFALLAGCFGLAWVMVRRRS